MMVVLAGASGFLGTHLTHRLRQRGCSIIRLVRRPPRSADECQWNPETADLDPSVIHGADAVVNLCGISVARLWTNEARRKIRDSRVTATSTLASVLAETGARPATLLNASAVGFYGDTGDQEVTEESPAGAGFLSDVCQDWEAATRPAVEAGVRVVHLRTGLVLDSAGGLLQPMVPLFRLGLGCRFGDGQQYWPWIALADWLTAVTFIMGRPGLSGPVNLVGPMPVTNAEFTAALGHALRQTARVAIPAGVLRCTLGDFSSELLGSKRVLPQTLMDAGFTFGYPSVASALIAALPARLAERAAS